MRGMSQDPEIRARQERVAQLAPDHTVPYIASALAISQRKVQYDLTVMGISAQRTKPGGNQPAHRERAERDVSDYYQDGLKERDWQRIIARYAAESGSRPANVCRWLSDRVTLQAGAQLLGQRCSRSSLHALGQFLEHRGYIPPVMGSENDTAAPWIDGTARENHMSNTCASGE